MGKLYLAALKRLPPITEKDRQFKAENEAEGNPTDLGEDIEIKEKLAKRFNWKKTEKPLLRVLMRNGTIVLYKDYYYEQMMSMEEYKLREDYWMLINEKKGKLEPY